jgi:hypothetical protein
LEKYAIKGTKIYLFRMPVEQSTRAILNQTARVQFERKLIAQLLVPISQTHLMPEDSQHIYHTTDGVHLTKDDADYFVSYLLNLSAGQK